VVKANAEHETDASGSFVLHGFIAAESPLGAAVTTHVHSDIAIVSTAEAARWRQTLADPKTLDSGRVKRWISTLMRDGVRPPVDPRVDRVIQMLQRHALDTHSTSLAQLSRVAGLSPSRFAHVFTESIGIPLRPYLRWLRLQRAARELMSGSAVTQAAHVAGFADAAHLTRTFRRMLSIVPIALIHGRGASSGSSTGSTLKRGSR
jgi:AraC-like DNA-binding protein